MSRNRKRYTVKAASLCMICAVTLAAAACGGKENGNNLVIENEETAREIVMFSPMEKTEADTVNTARSAADKTIIMAEEKLGVSVSYVTYTAEDYQDKTYDEVTLDRARNNMDDMYLLNPDTIQALGEEGRLMDLSGLAGAENLRDVVKTANVVNGKLVAIPQEVVAYGLFINQDMFDRYALELPQTPEEFLECCRVFKENGIETPVGANRWWLETFVLAQAYADLYNGGNTEAEIAALNSGESKYSDYMRPGFEFLQEMIDQGYIDAKKACVSEAIEGEGVDFLAQKTPIVMAYWGAATGFGVGAEARHAEDAMRTLEVMTCDEALKVYAETNKVISPSKNVEVECIKALKPLNDRIQENVYVLGANAGMKMEQWGNTCMVVRKLLGGATVDECMAELDRLQEESIRSGR